MDKSLLQFSNISKTFGETRALKGVDFDVREGEIHALVGENGAGKSTLIRILAGDFPSDTGTMLLSGSSLRLLHPSDALAAGIGFVHQRPPFIPELSITENFLLGLPYQHRLAGLIDWQAQHRECAASLASLGLSIDPGSPLASLSAHQRQMVALGRALLRKPKLLVLDEVTASLSEPEVRTLLDTIRRLKERGVSVIYVSHRLEEVFRIADRVTVLRDGRRISTTPLSEMTEAGLVRDIVGSEMKDLFAREAGQVGKKRETLVSIQRLGDKKLADISFDIAKGEIVGIAGLGGSGRSRILRMLAGASPRTAGDILIEGKPVVIGSVREALRAGIALVTEERSHDGFVETLPIWQNVSLPWGSRFRTKGFLNLRAEQHKTNEAMQRFSVRMPSIYASMSALSGGNQQKVIFSRWVIGPIRLLLLDEPTHGVDIGSKTQIYGAIREFAHEGRGVLVVSSELEELQALCDRVLLLKEGTIIEQLSGTDISKDAILHRLLSSSDSTKVAV